ncbi:hypothetical protein SCHPADRAFT_940262 [Schizopora paradoxa]|uniref:GATA-type domain-containing protein n=1 Tax=Schizopora paradoxa TaxID=27342 RepID=A0A0H2S9Q8_9AGAM|nr:hypothetical protein SCHPADRAFT_940262 [Schizopora paradoxa]
MPSSILNLKFKGNKSFVAFSNLGDSDSLTKTWKVCSKVASYLEQGQRLENLSWRLWHLQNLMVETDNAKSKREFKKLSKVMGDKLDKEKGRSIEELEAPDFKLNHAAEKLRQRAEEKERNREATSNGRPIKRMQFTFSVDQPANLMSDLPVKKPDLKPSQQFKDTVIRRTRTTTRAPTHGDAADASTAMEGLDKDPPSLTDFGRKPSPPRATHNDQTNDSDDSPSSNVNNGNNDTSDNSNTNPFSLRFPSYFGADFAPHALLFPSSYDFTAPFGSDNGMQAGATGDRFNVARPTIEVPLDEILNEVNNSESPGSWSSSAAGSGSADIEMGYAEEECSPNPIHRTLLDSPRALPPLEMPSVPPMSLTAREALPTTIHPSQVNGSSSISTRSSSKPNLTVKTSNGSNNRSSSGPSATATTAPAMLSNTAPGGQKAECVNCGATHTPLWRRGLNDELNCNACGLYCKLHKRPRPKSMRNNHGEGRSQTTPRTDSNDAMGEPAQCYNCHTTATPLWRKDDEGKTVCNACGLYYKLHGSARPISMKSDVIRKRSRHDARRIATGETPSASPGASRRASPIPQQLPSPVLAPDSSTAHTYGYDEYDYSSTPQSDLMAALGPDGVYSNSGHYDGAMSYHPFAGPYHQDYLQKTAYSNSTDIGPYSHGETSGDSGNGAGDTEEDRFNKRRRLSVDSASEPPSSTASYSSYATEPSSATTAHSQRSSLEYSPYGSYPNPYDSSSSSYRSSTSSFWHPPMLPHEKSPYPSVHPPMLPSEECPMDFLHPPMLLPQQEDHDLFASYLHPPMVIGDESPMAPMSSLHPPMLPGDNFYSGSQPQQQNQSQSSASQSQAHAQKQSHGRGDYYESSMRSFDSNYGSV